MSKVLRYPDVLRTKDNFGVWSDFTEDQNDSFFIDTITDSGSVTMGDVVGGVAALVPSDGSVADNDEAYFASPNAVFKFASGKPAYAEARVQFTEANTDDANVFFGFMSAVGANSLVDDGAGPKTSYSGAVIFKVDGGTMWKVQSSNGSTQTTDQTNVSAGGANYQTLGIEVLEHTTAQCRVAYTIDGIRVKDSQNREIIHYIAYSGLAVMQLGLGVKNGGANLETLNADYAGGWQVR